MVVKCDVILNKCIGSKGSYQVQALKDVRCIKTNLQEQRPRHFFTIYDSHIYVISVFRHFYNEHLFLEVYPK